MRCDVSGAFGLMLQRSDYAREISTCLPFDQRLWHEETAIDIAGIRHQSRTIFSRLQFPKTFDFGEVTAQTAPLLKLARGFRDFQYVGKCAWHSAWFYLLLYFFDVSAIV